VKNLQRLLHCAALALGLALVAPAARAGKDLSTLDETELRHEHKKTNLHIGGAAATTAVGTLLIPAGGLVLLIASLGDCPDMDCGNDGLDEAGYGMVLGGTGMMIGGAIWLGVSLRKRQQIRRALVSSNELPGDPAYTVRPSPRLQVRFRPVRYEHGGGLSLQGRF
jgi:hypothetical protein